MLQAWIVSPNESLYFAAAATPDSLASLRRHIRKMQRRLRGRLHVALRFDGPGVGAGSVEVAAFLRQLAAVGIRAMVAAAGESSGTLRPPMAENESSPRGGVLGRAWGASGHVTNHLRGKAGGGRAIAARL